MILAGDIGGTKVNFGLFDFVAGELRLEQFAGYLVKELGSLDEALEKFLKDARAQPDRACIGVAGPVLNGRCQLTNVDLEIDSASLKSRFGFSKALLVNDLAATAASLPLLKEADLLVLQAGKPVDSGRKAVVSAGTGLGQAYLISQGDGKFQILDTEGGQCGFAPSTHEQLKLCSSFIDAGLSLTIEDLLSGPGLERIYKYFNKPEESSKENEGTAGHKIKLTAAEILEESCQDDSSLGRRVINLFASMLGAVSGDMALRLLATGGVYIGGGIPPKILKEPQQKLFLESFRNKKKFNTFMESVPVYMIINERAPLWGAAGLLVNPHIIIPES
ncbi:MAG: glucokinase [Candidatus Nitronauta litoralis]|uniref:Glucokinase n=1 Tax=Candidatus Nitronauta litoralis TaxID=2705533 RepID=A0A7T0G1M3_9BACT|nr:MAG: glucokinase [Candidatus Nitronauta litoralis]